MSDTSTPQPGSQPQNPEELSLRARPVPITRISRRALVGAASLVLLLLVPVRAAGAWTRRAGMA